MMDDYLHVYNSADNLGDDQKGNYDCKMNMVPLKPLQEEKSEYEQSQVMISVLFLPKMNSPMYESTTDQQQNDHTELNKEIQL